MKRNIDTASLVYVARSTPRQAWWHNSSGKSPTSSIGVVPGAPHVPPHTAVLPGLQAVVKKAPMSVHSTMEKSERTRSLQRKFAKTFNGQRQKRTSDTVAMIENTTVMATVTVTKIAVTEGMVVHASTEKPARNSVRESVSKADIASLVEGRVHDL